MHEKKEKKRSIEAPAQLGDSICTRGLELTNAHGISRGPKRVNQGIRKEDKFE